jgi:hypothetical protein
MKKTLLIHLVLLATVSAQVQRGYVRDKIEDNYKDKYGQPGMEKYNDWMQGKVMNAKLEPEYNFLLYMNMQMTSYKNGQKKDVTDMKYYLNPASANFGMAGMDKKKADESLIVYDMKGNVMLMLDMRKMTGVAINMNAFMSGEATAEREKRMQSGEVKENNADCKKTGKTKTIQGYSCDEYICADKDRNTRSEIWISQKLPVNIARANMRGPMSAYFRSMQGMSGMLMEANFYKNDVLESNMLVTEINEKANLKVKTADYKINQ